MEEYLGVIRLYAGKVTPSNFKDCDGELLSISQYSALFLILGTTYGGDGKGNFALPDLRGRVPIGITNTGLEPYPTPNVFIGQSGGASSVTLAANNIPAGSYTLNVSSGNSTFSIPVAGGSIAVPGVGSGGHGGTFNPTLGFNAASPNVALNSNSITANPTGPIQPVNAMPPYLGVRYIICINGIMPS